LGLEGGGGKKSWWGPPLGEGNEEKITLKRNSQRRERDSKIERGPASASPTSNERKQNGTWEELQGKEN